MRRPFPYRPAPYDARANLPEEIRTLPFTLLRSKLYPKYKDVTKAAIARAHRRPDVPYAILPQANGPFSRPVGAMVATMQGQKYLRSLQEVAEARVSGPLAEGQYPTPPLPNVADRTYRTVPGYGVHNVPFHPRVLPGPNMMRMKELLDTAPWKVHQDPVNGPQAVQSRVDQIRNRIERTFYGDPTEAFTSGPVRWRR